MMTNPDTTLRGTESTDAPPIRQHLTEAQVELIQRAAECLRGSDFPSDWAVADALEEEFGCEQN